MQLSPSPTDEWATASPTPSATTAPAQVVILAVDKDWEYVDIQNTGSVAQDLTGWYILSENGNSRCNLSGTLEAGDTLRIWTMAQDVEAGDATCNLNGEMWNDDEADPAALYNANGLLVDRKEV
jgi:hypothetical protein